MFEHLLVAVDGSKHSRRAIEAASGLALKLGSRLTILHVIAHAGDNRIPDDLKEFARVEHIQTDEAVILETVGNAIVDRAKQEAISKGVEAVETALLRGDAATEIIQFAAENDVDTIVMGRRGLGDFAGLLLGSVSHKVAQRSDLDCLTVGT